MQQKPSRSPAAVKWLSVLFSAALWLTVNPTHAQQASMGDPEPTQNAGYYRGPSMAGSTLVFSAEGDLWRAQLGMASSAKAHRLTTHPAVESQALISPDGRMIAFVANYTGTGEVYLMPVDGGVPQRATFEVAQVRLQHWVNDHEILYSTSSRPGAPSNWTLKTLDIQSLTSEALPVADAMSGFLHRTDQQQTLFFVQFGIQLTSDNTNFYRGGMRGRLWRFDMDRVTGQSEAVPLLADHPGNIRDPFVYRGENTGRLYFVSDADGRDNIWSTDLQGKDLTQISFFKDWAVREISLTLSGRRGQLVLRRGADLYTLDLTGPDAGQAQLLHVEIPSDHPEMRSRWIKKPLQHLTTVSHTGDADKVLLTARGKMALIGTDNSRLVTINTPTTSRSRDGRASPDGRWVYALNDQSGELEVWRLSSTGSDEAKQLTNDGSGFKRNLQIDPSGNWLSYEDDAGALWLLSVETGKRTQIKADSQGFCKLRTTGLVTRRQASGGGPYTDHRYPVTHSAVLSDRPETGLRHHGQVHFPLTTLQCRRQMAVLSFRAAVLATANPPLVRSGLRHIVPAPQCADGDSID